VNKLRAIVAGVAFLAAALIFAGGQVPGCLGPAGVTLAQCGKVMAEQGRPFAPGPGAGAALAVGVPLLVLVASLIPWSRLDTRARAWMLMAAAVAGAGGAIYYELIRPTSITQTNSFSGQTHTAPLVANAESRVLMAMFFAALAAVTVAWLLALRDPRTDRVARANGE
jgi:hypothetical protein